MEEGLVTIMGQGQVLTLANVSGWQRISRISRIARICIRLREGLGRNVGQILVLISANVSGWQGTDRVASHKLVYLGRGWQRCEA